MAFPLCPAYTTYHEQGLVQGTEEMGVEHQGGAPGERGEGARVLAAKMMLESLEHRCGQRQGVLSPDLPAENPSLSRPEAAASRPGLAELVEDVGACAVFTLHPCGSF